MAQQSISSRLIFLQGKDLKAEKWARHFPTPVRNFTTVREMFSVLIASRRGDVVIFRYQNNPPRFLAAVAVFLIITAQVLKGKTFGQKIVWICHNVDRETQPCHPVIQKLRRKLLFRFADAVFVLDPAFVAYCERSDAVPISFGPKEGGSISSDNLRRVEKLAKQVDRIVLIAGQDGGKYRSFDRIPEIHSRFAELGFTTGFVTAGMAPSQAFVPEIEQHLVRIDEKNIRESRLSHVIDYIYRENSDVSIPYSIYAAATAGIPVLTRRGSILEEIVNRERIGAALDDFAELSKEACDFEGFLRRHSWRSLYEQLVATEVLP